MTTKQPRTVNLELVALASTLILKERQRQERLAAEGRFYGTCADPKLPMFVRLSVLQEELGEVSTALLNIQGFSRDIGIHDETSLKEELIQLAACCVAWFERLEEDHPEER